MGQSLVKLRRKPLPKMRCVLCRRNLRKVCRECRLGRQREPCMVILDSNKGYRHTHCAIAREGWKPT